MKARFRYLVLALLLATWQAQAATPKGALPAIAEYTEGEVMLVDAANGTVVLQHAFIKNLGMDPMAMEFDVENRAMLRRLKKGDKVLFKATYRDRKYVLVEVRPRK